MLIFASVRALCAAALAVVTLTLLTGCHTPARPVATAANEAEKPAETSPKVTYLPVAIPAIDPQRYTIIDLGPLHGKGSIGEAINASGQVAGDFNLTDAGASHAARWTEHAFTDLDALGGSSSSSFGINDSGQVAGTVFAKDHVAHYAVRWTGATAIQLSALGGTESEGHAINNRGQIAGYSTLKDSDVTHAVRWTGTTPTVLATLGGSMSAGLGINASGQVAGFSTTTGDKELHAVRWTETVAADLGALGKQGSTASAINDSGQVAGESYIGDTGVSHAVRWTGTTATDLGTLGNDGSKGWGINNHGVVVGDYELKKGHNHAFIATGDTMVDLNTRLPPGSGWVLEDARAINDNGWITGRGSINGHLHAYLLKPATAPEPSALAVFGIGAMAIGMGGFGRLKSLLQRRKVRLRRLHTQHKFPAS